MSAQTSVPMYTLKVVLLLLSSLVFSSSLALESEQSSGPVALRWETHASSLLGDRRDPTRTVQPACPGSEYSSCGADLPTGFCCRANEVCLPLAANTTALCCPQGVSCARIQPVECNIQAQNITAAPKSPIHTLALYTNLSQCGKSDNGASTCCPFGYHCDNGACVLDSDQGEDIYGYLILERREAAAQNTTKPTFGAEPSELGSSGGGVSRIGIAVGSAAVGSFSLAAIVFFFRMKRAKIPSFTMLRHKSRQRRSMQEKPLPPLPLQTFKPSPLPPYRKLPNPGTVPLHAINTQPAYTNSFSPIELPATPLSYNMWSNRNSSTVSKLVRPTSTFHPYQSPWILEEQIYRPSAIQ